MKEKRFTGVIVHLIAVCMALALCVQTAHGQTSGVSFPSGFIGTWKRDNYGNTLTFTANTARASTGSSAWTLTRINGNSYSFSNGNSSMTLTIRLANGNIEISGDSGEGQNNWNGVWKKQTQAATPAQNNAQPSTQAQVRQLQFGTPQTFTMARGNVHWFIIRSPERGSITVETTGNLDTVINAFYDSNSQIAEDDDSGEGYNARLTIKAEPNRQIYFRVRLAGSSAGNYTILASSSAQAQAQAEARAQAKVTAQAVAASTPVPGANLTAKLVWALRNAQSGGDYTIELAANESLSAQTLAFEGKMDVTVRFSGSGGERIITLTDNGSLFTVEPGVTLVLDKDITLRGHSRNNAPLIRVNGGGFLILREGAKITGNTTSLGGGVYTDERAYFFMFGGEISGNTSSSTGLRQGHGGGVYAEGDFVMSGGEISGNKSSNSAYSSNGGGVYIGYSGTFTMSGGRISGNTASGNYVSSGGGGVYAEGDFVMSGGEISGNTAQISGSGNGGGGVYAGAFTMSGGNIFGNTSSLGGGGVYAGTFTKTRGTIYGYTEGDPKSNVVKNTSGVVQNDKGHAVYVDASKRRESTVGPDDTLDPSKTGLAGGWGY